MQRISLPAQKALNLHRKKGIFFFFLDLKIYFVIHTILFSLPISTLKLILPIHSMHIYLCSVSVFLYKIYNLLTYLIRIYIIYVGRNIRCKDIIINTYFEDKNICLIFCNNYIINYTTIVDTSLSNMLLMQRFYRNTLNLI